MFGSLSLIQSEGTLSKGTLYIYPKKCAPRKKKKSRKNPSFYPIDAIKTRPFMACITLIFFLDQTFNLKKN